MLKNSLLSAMVVSAMFSLACADTKVITEEELGYRNSNLYEENLTIKGNVDYSKKEPGESTRIARSYENAPPLIPHSVKDYLPIKKDMNMCIECHAPAVAKDVGAIPTPKSHLVSYRPVTQYKDGVLKKEGKEYKNTADIQTTAHDRKGISMDRFNCSLCHVPQSNNAPLVKNEFEAEFRSKKDMNSSNLADILNEGVSYQK
ncbi:MAG: nitrate reductase cytochrome c-type subunit [Campylobacteraceae bacterium]|nr:nitrate reductase cytochrome c-type subunit [Campylobacteraceae bacterium]